MTRQFCSFQIGEYLFGIDVLLIREINKPQDITPVDRAPDYIRGLLNLRGQIVTVIDPGVRLGIGEQKIDDNSRIIVLKTTPELQRYRSEGFVVEDTSLDNVGLLVGQVDDIVEVDDGTVEPVPANVEGVDARYVGGVVKLEKRLMMKALISELLKFS